MVDAQSVQSLAAVVFTDLVGSTEMRSRVGDDAADEFRRLHDAALGDAVRENAGRVVKGLGDGIMAVFAGAAEAVVGAVAIQQALTRVGRRSSEMSVRIRVGISAGDVAFEGNDAFGTPVVEAARLCARADGGQILASDVVRVLAGSRCRDMFAPVGALALKGLPEPVTAWAVVWEPISAEVLLPRGLSTNAPWSFVGRRDELDCLAAAWRAATGGERKVVFVGGEPGIGKTRFLAEFARRAADLGALVLYGRAEEDLGVAYEPFTEALGEYVRACKRDALVVQLGPSGGELTRLMPDLATLITNLPPPVRSDPETERYRLFEAVRELLDRVARDQPLLLILDDLHWATKPDALLLAHLLRSASDAPILVLCAYCDTDVDTAHPLTSLLDDVPRIPGAEHLRLFGLDTCDVGTLIADVTDTELDSRARRLASAVQAETAGNPLFVCEILRHLLEHGMVERVERSAGSIDLHAIGVPEGVRAIIERRTSQLPTPTVEVLRTAAIIGARFDLPLLLAAGDGDGDHAASLAALANAEAHSLIAPEPDMPGWYRFAHALVRDTITATMPSVQRLALHRRVGSTLEQQPDAERRIPELAHHFTVSAPLGDGDRAIDFNRRAGDQALDALAFEEAVLHYKHALELVAVQPGFAEEARCDLLIALGGAQMRGGQPESREVLLEAAHIAERLGDADRLARAALANNPGFFSVLGVDSERVAVIKAALKLAPPERTATRARLLGLLAVETYASGNRPERERLTDEAVAIARELHDDATLAYALVRQNASTWSPANLDRRLAAAKELRELADRLGDPVIAYYASDFFSSYLGASDIDQADRCLADERQIVETLGQPYFKWCCKAWHETMRALHGGQFADAERLAGEALEIGNVVREPSEAFKYWGSAIAMIRFEQGRIGELVPIIEEFPTDQMVGIDVRTWLALAYTETARTQEARTLMKRNTADEFDEIIDEGHMVLPTAALLAETAARVGDTEWAKRLIEALRPCCGQIAAVATYSWGAVDRYVGLCASTLGDDRAAASYFDAAIDVNHRARAPSWEARSCLDLASLLADGIDKARATQLAHAALGTADTLGMAAVARRARELLTTLK